MAEQKRAHRKNISSQGIIYLAKKELDITVRNLSITGLMAELDANRFILEIDDVFHALALSVRVDIYLPIMRLAGDAEVVRAEKIDGLIHFAVEFRNLSYNVDNLLYKRKCYRKALEASGDIYFNNELYPFLTKNVSVEGVQIQMQETVDIAEGEMTIFNFPQLKLKGWVKVVWSEEDSDGSTMMGLQYLQVAREYVDGVPSFSN